ncbi:MAG: hypothetical protein JXA19_02375 [Anaerolineales bacterium]|nr:hypothetical protein [Anaerolineales bacterium]
MKLAFLIDRKNFLRYFGPLIKKGLQQGYTIECWLGQVFTESNSKSHLNMTTDDIPEQFEGKMTTKIYHSFSEIDDLILATKPDAVFTCGREKGFYYQDCPPKSDCPFVTLQVGIDTFIQDKKLDTFFTSDLFCYQTEFWREWAARYFQVTGTGSQNEYFSRSEDAAFYSGSPLFEQFSDIDPVAVKRKWGIPQEKKVVLLLPVTLSNMGDYWSRFFNQGSFLQQYKHLFFGSRREASGMLYKYFFWPFRGWNDQKLNKTIREFCDRNNALLIVKGREKDPIRSSLVEVADKILVDQSFYPFTTLEALCIADLCIHFYSTASMEAAFSGIPAITIDRPSPFIGKKGAAIQPEEYAEKIWWNDGLPNAYNFPGVNKWMKLPDVFTQLPEMKLSELSVTNAEKDQYLEKYTGTGRISASSMILEEVKKRFG